MSKTSINSSKPGEIGIFNTMLVSGPVIIKKESNITKTLLVKHGDKPAGELRWKFCGGKLIKNSTLEENAIREAREEIGIDIKITGLLPTITLWNETPETGSGEPDVIVLFHFIAEIDDEPEAGEEILDMQWFDIDNLPSDISPNIAPTINAYKKLYD